jgi:hypothetical protein
MTDFNRTNCPLLYNFDTKQNITYGDWVKILGGNPNTNALNARSCGRIRSGTHDGYLSDNNGMWGRTFGKFKGLRGRPICESKPLDDIWFYYDVPQGTGRWSLNYGYDQAGMAKGSYSLTTNPLGDCIVRQYYASGWQNYYFNPNYLTASMFADYIFFTLNPGIYLMGNFPYYDGGSNYHRCGWIVKEGASEVIICNGGLTSGAWSANNLIFFVDDEVQIRPHWWGGSGTGNMMFMLFKITPPGYWE